MEERGGFEGDADRGGIVSARGTGDGLVIRIDGRVASNTLLQVMKEFLSSRRSFLEGNEVSIEWIGSRPHEATVEEISTMLVDECSVTIRSSRDAFGSSKSSVTDEEETEEAPKSPVELSALLGRKVPSRGDEEAVVSTLPSREKKSASLFGGIEAFYEPTRGASGSKGKQKVSDEILWDEPNARVVCATLRSGQRIETEHSLIICGDINSGAEVVAGGDIVVLGTLRGVAHAGAYDETGGGRVIIALNLQPTQLRIGTVISRGASDARNAPEIARIDGAMIVVEPYHPRVMANSGRSN